VRPRLNKEMRERGQLPGDWAPETYLNDSVITQYCVAIGKVIVPLIFAAPQIMECLTCYSGMAKLRIMGSAFFDSTNCLVLYTAYNSHINISKSIALD